MTLRRKKTSGARSRLNVKPHSGQGPTHGRKTRAQNPRWTRLATGIPTRAELGVPDGRVEECSDHVADQAISGSHGRATSRSPELENFSETDSSHAQNTRDQNPHWTRLATGILTKPENGAAQGHLEEEADRVADQVVSGGSASRNQETEVTGSGLSIARSDQASAFSGASPTTSTSGPSRLSHLGEGTPLSASERGYFEPRFGQDLGSVRLHTGAKAEEAAESAGARAFTYGDDIVFGEGEYRSDSADGRKLMAHELTHVLQQHADTNSGNGSGPTRVTAAPLGVAAKSLPSKPYVGVVQTKEKTPLMARARRDPKSDSRGKFAYGADLEVVGGNEKTWLIVNGTTTEGNYVKEAYVLALYVKPKSEVSAAEEKKEESPEKKWNLRNPYITPKDREAGVTLGEGIANAYTDEELKAPGKFDELLKAVLAVHGAKAQKDFSTAVRKRLPTLLTEADYQAIQDFLQSGPSAEDWQRFDDFTKGIKRPKPGELGSEEWDEEYRATPSVQARPSRDAVQAALKRAGVNKGLIYTPALTRKEARKLLQYMLDNPPTRGQWGPRVVAHMIFSNAADKSGPDEIPYQRLKEQFDLFKGLVVYTPWEYLVEVDTGKAVNGSAIPKWIEVPPEDRDKYSKGTIAVGGPFKEGEFYVNQQNVIYKTDARLKKTGNAIAELSPKGAYNVALDTIQDTLVTSVDEAAKAVFNPSQALKDFDKSIQGLPKAVESVLRQSPKQHVENFLALPSDQQVEVTTNIALIIASLALTSKSKPGGGIDGLSLGASADGTLVLTATPALAPALALAGLPLPIILIGAQGKDAEVSDRAAKVAKGEGLAGTKSPVRGGVKRVEHKVGKRKYTFDIDAEKRVIRAEGDLVNPNRLKNKDRSKTAQVKVAGGEGMEIHAGHLIADFLGGPGAAENLVMMTRELNQIGFGGMERVLADLTKTNKKVRMKVRVHYEGNHRMPSRFTVDATITGRDGTVHGRRWTFEQEPIK